MRLVSRIAGPRVIGVWCHASPPRGRRTPGCRRSPRPAIRRGSPPALTSALRQACAGPAAATGTRTTGSVERSLRADACGRWQYGGFDSVMCGSMATGVPSVARDPSPTALTLAEPGPPLWRPWVVPRANGEGVGSSCHARAGRGSVSASLSWSAGSSVSCRYSVFGWCRSAWRCCRSTSPGCAGNAAGWWFGGVGEGMPAGGDGCTTAGLAERRPSPSKAWES